MHRILGYMQTPPFSTLLPAIMNSAVMRDEMIKYFKELCELIMEDEGLEPATTAEEAFQLYFDLPDHINAIS